MPIYLSAFGDEIAPDLPTQLTVLQQLQVGYLEFRSAWGKNIKDLNDSELQRAYELCQCYNIRVNCLGSPIGKTPILARLEDEIAILERLFQVGDLLGSRAIRIFSFYPPQGEPIHAYLDMAIERLQRLTTLAQGAGFVLLLENDEDLVGSRIETLHPILQAIQSPALRHAWDGANFVASGESDPTTHGWERLQPYLGTVHIKDFRRADRTRRASGEGDAELAALFTHLGAIGYHGFFAIEPHPYHVDGRGELHGAEGMRYAVEACRRLMQKIGLSESVLTEEPNFLL
jgi:sugar phosphate isomerase/epimerase